MASGYKQPGNWAGLKAHILRRDRHTCYVCGGQATSVDHRVPISQGGSHRPDNLAAICGPCHATKTEHERLAGIEAKRASRLRPAERHPGAIA